MVDELRRAALALLEDPPRPPGGLEDLAHRNARRHRRRRALSGAVGAVLALVGLTVVADGKAGDDAQVVTVPKPPDGGIAAFPATSGALLVPAVGAPVTVDLGGSPARLGWSSDGAWLAGVVDGRLQVVARDGSGRRTVPLDGVAGFRWSPVAPILAVQAADGLHTVTPRGRPHRIGDGSTDLLWSPDGHQLAFQDRDLEAGGIVIVDADGTHRRIVGRYADLPDAAAGLQIRGWALDGRVLLYRAHDQALGDAPDPGQSLVALDVEDGSTFPLGTVLGRYQWVQVSPDGRSVAFTSGVGMPYTDDKVLRSCDLVARRCADLTPADRTGLDPRWSPDGTRLAYVSAPVGAPLTETRLRVIGADGSGDHEVRGGGAGAREPMWTADGTAIVQPLGDALDDDPPTVVIERVPVDGGEVRRIGPIELDPVAVVRAPARSEAIWSWSAGAAASDP